MPGAPIATSVTAATSHETCSARAEPMMERAMPQSKKKAPGNEQQPGACTRQISGEEGELANAERRSALGAGASIGRIGAVAHHAHRFTAEAREAL